MKTLKGRENRKGLQGRGPHEQRTEGQMCWPSGKNHRGGGQRIKGSKGRNQGRGEIGEGLKRYVP